MTKAFRFMLSLLLGCVSAIAIALACVVAARTFWPAYAVAEPHKAYTLTMLFARLIAGAVSVAGAACGTSAFASDRGRTAWWLGGLFLVLSIPNHLYPGYVWNDYPVWYHLIYLAYLVPVAGWTGLLFGKLFQRSSGMGERTDPGDG